ncbi:hypothetical protein D3C72_1783670 [compost metagenome]
MANRLISAITPIARSAMSQTSIELPRQPKTTMPSTARRNRKITVLLFLMNSTLPSA